MEINEALINNIVNKVRDKINDKMSYSQEIGPKPTSINDVVKGNGWVVGKILDKGPGYRVFTVFKNMNTLKPTTEMSVEELVEDMNVYFEDNNKSMRASVSDTPSERGSVIRVERTAYSMPQGDKIAKIVAESTKKVLKEMQESELAMALDTLDPIFKQELINWSNQKGSPYQIKDGKIYVYGPDDAKSLYGLMHEKPYDDGRAWVFEIPEKYLKH